VIVLIEVHGVYLLFVNGYRGIKIERILTLTIVVICWQSPTDWSIVMTMNGFNTSSILLSFNDLHDFVSLCSTIFQISETPYILYIIYSSQNLEKKKQYKKFKIQTNLQLSIDIPVSIFLTSLILYPCLISYIS